MEKRDDKRIILTISRIQWVNREGKLVNDRVPAKMQRLKEQ